MFIVLLLAALLAALSAALLAAAGGRSALSVTWRCSVKVQHITDHV